LTSGYNNADGKGYFFILNPKTGALLQTIQAYDQTSCTAASVTDSGLAAATAFITDFTDFTADSVYAGDLCGNLWRLDLTSTATSNYPTPTLMAQFKSSANVIQPVTVAPTVAIDPSSSKRYVFVGTGRILASSDLNSAAEQTFYAIIDGTRTQFFTSSTLPSVGGTQLSYPITRSNLNNNTTGTTGITVSANTPLGWYIDLGFNTGATATTGSVAYRYNVPAAITDGIIAFVTNSPLTSGATLDDATCNPSGTYQTYAVSFSTGGSLLLNSSGASVKYLTNSGTATEINFLKVGNTVTLQSSNSAGTVTKAPGNFSGGSSGVQQLNWRELPSPD
jgi:type IV pilus assembly protein PilY1